MSDVSDMLYEFYRANAAAKVPKSTQPQSQQLPIMGSGATAAAVKYVGQTSPTSAETHEPSSIAAIATNGAASETASKNLQSDEMISSTQLPSSFHPRIKIANPSALMARKIDTSSTSYSASSSSSSSMVSMTAIPTSVVVSCSPPGLMPNEPLDIKPIINPATGLVMSPINPSVIKHVPSTNTSPADPQAAAIAAALIRDGYHSFQQQMRAQELIKFHTSKMAKSVKPEDNNTKILENFLRQQRNSECDNDNNSDYNDYDDDEEDSRYNGFDDIHLMEGGRGNLPQLLQNAMAANNSSTPGSISSDYPSDESQKYMNLAAQAEALRNLKFSLGDFGNTSPNDSMGPTGIGPDGEPVYECRHCGKKYRWKSTLRRHENVECGGKEPSHSCPYCPYKSKQRGNLGVHVRKHHSNLPQLASKRRSKYSLKFESNPSSACVSDDSNSKLIIDCSK